MELNNDKKIDQVFRELVNADQSFKQHEQEAKVLIARLLENRSAIKPSPEFSQTLLMDLELKIKELKAKTVSESLISTTMKKINYFMPIAVSLAIVALVAVSTFSGQTLFVGKQEIARASDEAFGKLASVSPLGGRGQGGGGSGGDAQFATPQSEKLIGNGGGDAREIFLPVNFKFEYNGEEFTIEGDKMDVLRRQKGFGSNLNVRSFLRQFRFDLFDINKFSNSQLISFNLMEDRDFGYSLNVDMREGTIHIGENWERWNTPDRACRDQACFDQHRLKISDIPADDQILVLANAFLDEYGIARDNYGDPVVMNFWRTEYERSTDKTSFYIPDYVSVIYPLKVNGEEIVDEGGNKTGLFVNVNVRANRVAGVSDLSSQRYQSSAYAVEQDAERIKNLALRGGFRAWYPVPEQGGRTETVELGTPSVKLVRMWHELDGRGQELLVPSLVFPVTVQPASFFGQSVIVPLIKDILDTVQEPPRILPLEAAQ